MPAGAGTTRTAMPAPKILVIPGSLRSGSHNVRLAALAAKEIALAEGEVTRISLEDYPLPLFDADLPARSGLPLAAVQLKKMIAAHHGVFITSPEYSASVTPLLKNAIDWVSRVREGGEPTYAAFKNRAYALGAASRSAGGGLRSLMALRQILELGCGALVIPEQVSVPGAEEAFDDMDNLRDAALSATMKTAARRLVMLAAALGDVPSIVP
jgi:chromate reductase, NAD(P)H dehydrogenase (quinone)